MSKNELNQNGKYTQKLKISIEPDFDFSNKPINRFQTVINDQNDGPYFRGTRG